MIEAKEMQNHGHFGHKMVKLVGHTYNNYISYRCATYTYKKVTKKEIMATT